MFVYSNFSLRHFLPLVLSIVIFRAGSASSTPSPPPAAPAPPGPAPAPPGPAPTIDPDASLKEIFDVINSDAADKGDKLFALYKKYQTCNNRIAIEGAFSKSQYQDDVNQMDQDGKVRARLSMATFLFGCAPATHYAYHMEVLKDQDNSARGVTEILVACSETAQLHGDFQTAYNDRFNEEGGITKVVDDLVSGDTKSVCGELLKRERSDTETPDQPADVAKTLIDEEPKWSDERVKLDSTLMELPLDQCQDVFVKFQEAKGKSLEDAFNEDFKDDEEKLTAYLQIYYLVQNVSSFYTYDLYYGIKEVPHPLYPMRILGATTAEDRADLEVAFKAAHSDVDLRQEVNKVLAMPDVDYAGVFFKQVLDLEWNATSSTPPTTPPPTPSTSPPPPPPKSPPPSPPTTPSPPPPATPPPTPPVTPPHPPASPSSPPPASTTPPPASTTPPPPSKPEAAETGPDGPAKGPPPS